MVFTYNLYQKFHDHIKENDIILYPLVQKYGFLKPLPKRDWFSILIGNIIGQKIRFIKARVLRGKLYTLLGTDNFTVNDFKNITQKNLLDLGVDDWQVEIIFRVFDFICQNNIEYEDIDRIIEVKGIGEWTLKNTKLMYSLQTQSGEKVENLLLTKDLIIKRGIKDLYGLTKLREIRNLEKKWSPYCGLVTWYLWKEYT